MVAKTRGPFSQYWMVPERSAQKSRPSGAKASAIGKLAATLPPGSRPPDAQYVTGGGGGGGGAGGGLGDGLGDGDGDGVGSGEGDGDGLGDGHPTAGHIRSRGPSACRRLSEAVALSTTSTAASRSNKVRPIRTAIGRSTRKRSRCRIRGTMCSGYRVIPRSGRWCLCRSSKGRCPGSL